MTGQPEQLCQSEGGFEAVAQPGSLFSPRDLHLGGLCARAGVVVHQRRDQRLASLI